MTETRLVAREDFNMYTAKHYEKQAKYWLSVLQREVAVVNFWQNENRLPSCGD